MEKHHSRETGFLISISEISAVKNIPSSGEGIIFICIRNIFFNQKYFLKGISSKYPIPSSYNQLPSFIFKISIFSEVVNTNPVEHMLMAFFAKIVKRFLALLLSHFSNRSFLQPYHNWLLTRLFYNSFFLGWGMLESACSCISSRKILVTWKLAQLALFTT